MIETFRWALNSYRFLFCKRCTGRRGGNKEEQKKPMNTHNAVVIGANEEAIFSIDLAHRYGLHVDALDGNANAAGMSRAEAAHHVDINDLEAVYRITDAVEPSVVLPAPIGHCLTTVGAVNDRYGLVGVSQKAASICTDKYLFHQELFREGLRDAQQILLPEGMKYGTAMQELLDQLTEYPVVVKPRYGSGSRSVEICGNDQELECLLRYEICAGKEALEEDYIAETCAAGPEYGIDGAYVDGEFRMVLLRSKKNTPPPYRQCVGYESVLPEEESAFYAACIEQMQRMGEVIGFENCVVHADVIRRIPDDGPFVIETSARPSGHNLSNLFTPLASGVTLVEDFLKLAVPEMNSGMNPEPNAKPDSEMNAVSFSEAERERIKSKLFRPQKIRKLRIRYYDLPPGRVVSIPDKAQLEQEYPLLAYECRIRPGDILGEVRDGASVMGRGYYILEGKDAAELDLADERIRNAFRITK